MAQIKTNERKASLVEIVPSAVCASMHPRDSRCRFLPVANGGFVRSFVKRSGAPIRGAPGTRTFVSRVSRADLQRARHANTTFALPSLRTFVSIHFRNFASALLDERDCWEKNKNLLLEKNTKFFSSYRQLCREFGQRILIRVQRSPNEKISPLSQNECRVKYFLYRVFRNLWNPVRELIVRLKIMEKSHINICPICLRL